MFLRKLPDRSGNSRMNSSENFGDIFQAVQACMYIGKLSTHLAELHAHSNDLEHNGSERQTHVGCPWLCQTGRGAEVF